MSDPITVPLSAFQKEAIALLNSAVAYATKERDAFIRGIVSHVQEDLNAAISLVDGSLVVTPPTPTDPATVG